MEGVDEQYALTIKDNGLSGARRLGIYSNGVALGFSDALAGVFETVKKLVGDDYFVHLAEKYVSAHPSQTGNIHDFGGKFPEFLDGFSGVEALPYLADVSRLEWAYHAAFHSPIGEMLNIEKLSQVPEARYGQLNLHLSPSCYLLSSDYPVLRIWQVNQDECKGDEAVSLGEGGVRLAIVREGKQIVFHSLDPAAFAMLEAVSQNVKFNHACEMALQINPDCDIGTVLQEAVLNRIIVGFSVNE